MIKRILGYGLIAFGAIVLLGAAIGNDNARTKISLAIFFLGVVGLGGWMVATATRSSKARVQAAEQQKLLALVNEGGTLNSPAIQVALGWTKEEADEALTRLRQSGLAELDLDEGGAPVYRVNKDALAVRQRKAW